jgi:hypothetical protein
MELANFRVEKKCLTPSPTEADAGRVKKMVGDVFRPKNANFRVEKKIESKKLRQFNVAH